VPYRKSQAHVHVRIVLSLNVRALPHSVSRREQAFAPRTLRTRPVMPDRLGLGPPPGAAYPRVDNPGACSVLATMIGRS
jgi:hypothetical protein